MMDLIPSLELRAAFGHYATGVTIVTARGLAGEPVGMTANSFSSLSLDPPLLLWSIARRSSNFEAFRSAPSFAIHVLHAGQQALARTFSARDADRFRGVETRAGRSGVPLLSDFHACFECETHARHEGGDHLIIVGQVVCVEQRDGSPLLFYRGRFSTLGD